MKKFLLLAAAAGALAISAPAASAAPGWQPINQRQAQIDRRIDQGVRHGDLTRREATQLRAEFDALEHLEARYRRHGLSVTEMRDLDRRFDVLEARVRFERNDRQEAGWQSINQRQRNIDARIDAGVRDGSLSRREASRLRREFNQIASLEADYRRSGAGLSMNERRDLDRRFDMLSRQVQAQRHDWNNRRG